MQVTTSNIFMMYYFKLLSQWSLQVDQSYFRYDEEKQFYCLKTRCMANSKGRSKGKNFEPYLHEKLRKLYEPFDRQIEVNLLVD